jgi:hypothetical protein
MTNDIYLELDLCHAILAIPELDARVRSDRRDVLPKNMRHEGVECRSIGRRCLLLNVSTPPRLGRPLLPELV